MSKQSARRPAQPRKPANTRRAQEAARRAARRRRRWIGWGVSGALAAGLVALVAVAAAGRGSGPSGSIAVGAKALDGTFTVVSGPGAGSTATIASLRGRPALVWFVATWCSSCQAGTETMASEIGAFAAQGVRVVELEMADDLGEPGPSISAFGQQLAGAAYGDQDWTWGEASSGLTTTYNPKGYLDIYYLLDSSGRIAYVNSSPASTMGQLLAEASRVGRHA